MEHNKQQELRGPLHLVRCAAQLGVMAVKELVYNIDQAIDSAWPDDSPEDAAVQSERWT